MGENYLFKYNVDMVFCIDATASMRPVINTVKNNALNFYHDVTAAMERKGKHINEMRIRVIAFRDYLADGDSAMMTTDFFRLPEQSKDFERCVKSIHAKGGGDTPEDGLEALGYAIKSKWTPGGDKRRNIIVVWTDASTHKLGYGKKSPCYPSGMAESFGELTSWWGDEQVRGRFLTHLSGWFCLRLMKRNGVLLRKTGIMSSIIPPLREMVWKTWTTKKLLMPLETVSDSG